MSMVIATRTAIPNPQAVAAAKPHLQVAAAAEHPQKSKMSMLGPVYFDITHTVLKDQSQEEFFIINRYYNAFEEISYVSVSLVVSSHKYFISMEDSPKNSSSKGYEPVSLALSKLKVDTATSQQQTHLLDNEFKQKYLSLKQKLKKIERVLFNSDECHFNFNLSDTQSAKRYVANELLKSDDVFAFYIYLNAKNSNKRSKEYFDDINKLNSLQEWIWLESSMTFNVLKSPIDIGAITFTISKYGTRNVWLEWTLPDTCGPNNPIGYYNESHRLTLYILENLIENNTLKDSYLCHRNFNCDTSFIEWCWWITTVWIGYDYNCYPIYTLRKGNFGSILISKTDLSKLLTFVVGLIGYMHPFLWHILESVQLPWLPKTKTRRELRKYYKDTSKIEKPYGYVREETKTKKDEANKKVESGTSAIEQICAANRNAESGRNKNEQNVDEITEDLFNYVVDNCSTVKRSSFLLIVKTFMTIIFLTVTLLILRDTGKLQDLNLNETVPLLVVLISPKVVSICTAYKTEDEIKRHKGDIEKLVEDFNTNGKTNNVHDIHVLNAYVICI
ncbi:unnamed protein product [Mytilus coruscus]|uniref:Uncharacterized protein n=1 Tax=Mytilus coruscus TaxID=42192 RepID=A0A6J8EBY5_MYTCO|nr:unnamed protein product [Mytilus coruscus]